MSVSPGRHTRRRLLFLCRAGLLARGSMLAFRLPGPGGPVACRRPARRLQSRGRLGLGAPASVRPFPIPVSVPDALHLSDTMPIICDGKGGRGQGGLRHASSAGRDLSRPAVRRGSAPGALPASSARAASSAISEASVPRRQAVGRDGRPIRPAARACRAAGHARDQPCGQSGKGALAHEDHRGRLRIGQRRHVQIARASRPSHRRR